MPTYAVLGATGSTGSELVKVLLQRPDITLHLYARSEDKLRTMFPKLSSSPQAKTFIGAVTDHKTMSSCLRGVDSIFCTVAQNANQPGCSVSITVAKTIVAALESLRKEVDASGYKIPQLCYLSSGELSPVYRAQMPWLLEKVVRNGSYFVYKDLEVALAYIAHEAPWLPVTRACPGAIVQGPAQGVDINLKEGSASVTYADLATAMVMMVEKEGFRGHDVFVRMTGPERYGGLLGNLIRYVFPGNVISWVPSSYGLFLWMGFL